MELLLLIIAILLFMIFIRLGTINHTYNLLYQFINQMMLRLEEFNPDEVKTLRYLLLDLDKIMPFIVEKKQYESKKWDLEKERLKEDLRTEEEIRFFDELDKKKNEKEEQ